MNAIGELDLELLEDYLDDALSPAQVEHVARRLADEPELALAMHELRAARVLRAATWRALEPTEAEAGRVADRVIECIRRDARAQRLGRTLRVAAGVAAAVAIFATGWSLRSTAAPSAADTPQVARSESAPQSAAVTRAQPAAATFHVALLDSRGNVIPVQQFAKADDARQFAQDLLTYEDRRDDARQGSAMLVSDRF